MKSGSACSTWKNRAEMRDGVLPPGTAAQLRCFISFNFHFRKSTWLKFCQRTVSPTLCPAVWEETPSQHGIWAEEADRCSASPGFPGTPVWWSSLASTAFHSRGSQGVHMQAFSPRGKTVVLRTHMSPVYFLPAQATVCNP